MTNIAQSRIDKSRLKQKTFSQLLAYGIKETTSVVRASRELLGVTAGAVALYLVLLDKLGAVVAAELTGGLLLLIIGFLVVRARRDFRQVRIEREEIEVQRSRIDASNVVPGTFTLSPIEVDSKQFSRPDRMDEEICNWIKSAKYTTLCLTGNSGVGKSSILLAAVLPKLRRGDDREPHSKWTVVYIRGYESPLDRLLEALSQPGAVWKVPPASISAGEVSAADAVIMGHRACERQKRSLLIIFDQFEEALPLSVKGEISSEFLRSFADFLKAVGELKHPGLKVLLSLRAEYLTRLEGFGFPPIIQGDSWREVKGFTERAAEKFLKDAKLGVPDHWIDAIVREAVRMDAPGDRARPIVLNMLGLFISRYHGSLHGRLDPDHLIREYLQRSLNEHVDFREAGRLARQFITDRGRRRVLSIEDAAVRSKVPVAAARLCLAKFCRQGLMRPLDETETRWEIAHDFVAESLFPLVQRLRLPSTQVVFIGSTITAALVIFFYAAYDYVRQRDEFVRQALVNQRVQLESDEAGGTAAIITNGTSQYSQIGAMLERLVGKPAHLSFEIPSNYQDGVGQEDSEFLKTATKQIVLVLSSLSYVPQVVKVHATRSQRQAFGGDRDVAGPGLRTLKLGDVIAEARARELILSCDAECILDLANVAPLSEVRKISLKAERTGGSEGVITEIHGLVAGPQLKEIRVDLGKFGESEGAHRCQFPEGRMDPKWGGILEASLVPAEWGEDIQRWTETALTIAFNGNALRCTQELRKILPHAAVGLRIGTQSNAASPYNFTSATLPQVFRTVNEDSAEIFEGATLVLRTPGASRQDNMTLEGGICRDRLGVFLDSVDGTNLCDSKSESRK